MNHSKPDRARLSTRPRHLLLALVLIIAGLLPGAARSARGETERLVRAGILQMDGLGQFHNQAGESLFDVVLTYAADKENWELERVPIPFSNGSAALMVQHEIELLAALPHTAEQSQQVRLSKEAVFTTWAQVCLANGIEAQSLLDLKELQVGIVRDDYFAEEIQRLAAGLDISCYFIEFNSAKEMLGALSSGWIQAGVTDRLVVETEGHAYDIIPSSIYFAPLKYHFAAPRDISPAVLEAVDYHLKQLKDDPESAYHHFIEGVFHTHNSSRIPVLLKWILIIAAGVFLLLLAANSVLRRQVRVKTSALANNNARLEEELRQRSRAEAALSESEKQFRSLFASSIAGIAIHRLEYNAEGRACDYTITDINPAFSTHTGIAAEGVRGSLGSVLYRSQPPPFLKCFAEVAETGLPQRFETLFDPLGKHFNVSVFSPRQHHFVTVFEDISGRKQAEENLRRSEEKYRLLIDHASDAILIVQQNKIRYGNPSAYRIAGLTGQDLIDRDFSDFLLPDDDLKHRRSDQAAHTAMHPSGKRPFRVINQAGETLWVEMSMVDIEWENRAATLCFIRDITQTKRLEEKLLESQKLQAIGTLAGGIAHDFNNLLAAIMGFTELTLHSIPDDDPIRPNLNHVLSASERAKALIQRILAFSRQPKKDLKPIAVAPLVSEALQLLRASLPSTIAMETQIADDTGIVLTEPAQINQIVMNLCTNGAHAMEGRKGVLRIALEACLIDPEAARGFVDLQPGRYACLSVADSGKGMDRETQKKIFDPYFTTKKIGEGTGLGLSMVHGIVKSLGGTIQVYSEPDKGSTFRIYLPLIEDAVEHAAALPMALETGNEHVLLVDDEELVLEMVAGMLEKLGYAVTKRVNSREALKAFEAAPDRYDLVISDQTMPGLTGRELAREIHRQCPDIPVILCSGFSAGFAEQPEDNRDVAVQLNKPLLMQELAHTIRMVLASPN